MRKKALIPVVAVALLAAGGAAILVNERTSEPDASPGDYISTPGEASKSEADGQHAVEAAHIGDTLQKQHQPHPFPDMAKSRDRLPLDADPFIAESKDEQRWLDRNGYPNAEQWNTYSSAPDHLLMQAADAGDKIAYVMLEGRALAKGDKTAINGLLDEASSGSNFAIMTLAAYMAGSPGSNLELGYAYSRVAEMRGDYRIAAAREGMFPRALTSEEKLRGEARALSIFNELKKASRINQFVDPRPIGSR